MSEDMVESIMNRELAWSIASIGIFLLTMVLPFVYFMRDCRRRAASDFPVLSYGAKTVSPFTLKKVWTWILILTFLSCTGINYDIFSNTMEIRQTISTGTFGDVYPPPVGGFSFDPAENTSPLPFGGPVENVSSSPGGGWSLTVPPPLKYELEKAGGRIVYEKIALSIPWLFLVGLFLYDRGVRKWPQGEKKDEA